MLNLIECSSSDVAERSTLELPIRRGRTLRRGVSLVQPGGILPIVSRSRTHLQAQGLTRSVDLLEIASDAPLISVVSEIPTRSRSDSSKGGLHPTSSLSYRSSPHSSTGPADESDDTFPPSKTQLARASTPRSVDTPRSHAPRMVLLTQIQALSRREIQNLRRDLNLVVMHNAVAVIIGLFVGGICQSRPHSRRIALTRIADYQTNSTIGGFQSRLGSLFFLGSLIAFAALSALTVSRPVVVSRPRN